MSVAANKREAQTRPYGWCDKCRRRRPIAFKCKRCRDRSCDECAASVEVKWETCIPCQIEEDYPDELPGG